MLKALTVTILCFSAIGMSGQPDKASGKKDSTAPQGQPPVISSDSPDEQTSGAQDQSEADSDTPAGDAPVERSQWWSKPDWWILIVAVVTGSVICWQSWETRKASTAALLNVQALVSAERSWLLVDNVVFCDDHKISYRITNCGNTPATILYIREYFDVTLAARKPPEGADFGEVILDPEEMMEGILPACGKWTRFTRNVSDNDYGLVMSGGRFLWVFGITLYEDVYGRHETRFCYRYVVDSVMRPELKQIFDPGGPPQYNRLT
jgi:hypothetical protein